MPALSVCSDLTLSLLLSSPLATPVGVSRYTWAVQSGSNAPLADFLATQNAPSIVVPASLMNPDTTYVFSLTLYSAVFDLTSATSTLSVYKSSQAFPNVGPITQQLSVGGTTANVPITLQATVSFPPCLPVQTLNFLWTQISGPAITLDNSRLSTTLTIPANTLSALQAYGFRFTASLPSDPMLNSSVTYAVAVVPQPPTVIVPRTCVVLFAAWELAFRVH